jgi:hypothetical protein
MFVEMVSPQSGKIAKIADFLKCLIPSFITFAILTILSKVLKSRIKRSIKKIDSKIIFKLNSR